MQITRAAGGTWAFRAGIAVAKAHDNVWVDTSGWPMVAGGTMEIALSEPADQMLAVLLVLVDNGEASRLQFVASVACCRSSDAITVVRHGQETPSTPPRLPSG
ncbi:MAG: hypothetical protein JXA57_12920 [Armatimonadetes bacterium]|nr:hypothetical protein [Armatimonadota bacterium]